MSEKTSQYDKPLPAIDDNNREFWSAARSGALKLQCCTVCGHIRYPISHLCPECLDEQFTWKTLSGKGVVFSSIVFHQIYNQAFADKVPYNVSIIQLDEGPRMLSNVVGVAPNAVKVGDKVQVVFDAMTDTVSIPQFKPI